MIDLSDLLAAADAYTRATSIKEVTLSHRLFGDSKKLPALRAGADITVGRFNAALLWLSANWPADAEWPKGVVRPEIADPLPTADCRLPAAAAAHAIAEAAE